MVASWSETISQLCLVTSFQGHLWQYRDITDRKANEQALVNTSQTLTQFSHNLKQIHRLNVKHFTEFRGFVRGLPDHRLSDTQFFRWGSGVPAG
jgi:hypothetical protein